MMMMVWSKYRKKRGYDEKQTGGGGRVRMGLGWELHVLL